MVLRSPLGSCAVANAVGRDEAPVASIAVRRSRVGVPGAERELTEALISQASRVYPPGEGRSVYLLPEPDIGRGRPDLLIIHASSAGIRAYMRQGLEIPSRAAAGSLFVDVSQRDSRYSPSHGRRLRQGMVRGGWTSQIAQRAAGLIHSSISVEAKIRDWRRAFR